MTTKPDEKLLAAIAAIDPAQPDQVTKKGGLPDLKYLSKQLGRNVTRPEVTAAQASLAPAETAPAGQDQMKIQNPAVSSAKEEAKTPKRFRPRKLTFVRAG